MFLASLFGCGRRRFRGPLLDRYELSASMWMLPTPTLLQGRKALDEAENGFRPTVVHDRGLGVGERNREWFDEVGFRWRYALGRWKCQFEPGGSWFDCQSHPAYGPYREANCMIDEPSV